MADISHIKALMEIQQSPLYQLGWKGLLPQKSIRMLRTDHGYRYQTHITIKSLKGALLCFLTFSTFFSV